MASAAARKASTRSPTERPTGALEREALSDILLAPFGDEAGRAERQHEQQEAEHHDIDQAGVEELRRVALDQADEEPCQDGALDIAEAADDDNRKCLYDH